ncbi:MAG: PEGA domain-containing protein [Myxococcota bacterium]|nr:PEGA domain-containing protein [Myxococcota bacterium]
MSRLLSIVLAFAVSSSYTHFDARSETPKRNSSKTRDEAKRLFRAGSAAYSSGQYLAAAQALEQSYELIPLPATAFSLAQAYRLQFFVDQDSRHLERAITLYRLYIDSASSGARRFDAVTSLSELEPIKLKLDQERKAELEIAPAPIEPYEPPTQIMIMSSAPQSTISIDGGPESRQVPTTAVVEPGLHVAQVKAPGYETVTKQVTAVEGRLIVINIEPKEKPARVWVKGVVGAQIWLNGRPVGQTPLAKPLMVPAGKHQIYVTKKGRTPWARNLTVERGGDVEIDVELPVTAQRTISYAVLSIGTLGLTTAGVVGLMALRDDQAAARLQEQRSNQSVSAEEYQQFRTLSESRDSHASLAWLTFGISLAVTGAGSLLYHFDGTSSPISIANSVLSVVPNDGGLTFSWSAGF